MPTFCSVSLELSPILKYSGIFVHELNLFYGLGEDAHVPVYMGRWPWLYLLPNVEFVKENKILSNTFKDQIVTRSVCGLKYYCTCL